MDRRLMRAGFLLLFLALLGGLAVPAFRVPRLALSAHIAGLLGGTLLIVIGGFRDAFTLGPRASALLRWGWVYSAYANWAACIVGAMSGARRFTPIAAGGVAPEASALAEGVVAFLLVSLTLVALAASAVGVWGLRARADGT